MISDPPSKTQYRTGLLSDAIAEDFSVVENHKAYIAGPPIMVKSVVERLKDLGIQGSDCHADAFYTEAEK